MIKESPKSIFLQFHENDGEITWSEDRINDSDVSYTQNSILVDFLESIIKVDKTQRYSYGTKGQTRNNKGELAGSGSRWKTTTEMAQDWLRELRKE